MGRAQLFILTSVLFFAFALNVKADSDDSLPNKTEIDCGGAMTFVSLQYGATSDSNTGNIYELKPVADAPDKRSVAAGVIALENNHQFAFAVTFIPKASRLVHGEDLITGTVRYQRQDGNRVKVLAESVLTSDQISSFAELNARRINLVAHAQMKNPEVSTALANMRSGSTPSDAVRAGQLPDGVTTTGSFNCYVKVGKSLELK